MRFAIVLGAPRSGTTFLMEVLDTMPATECVLGNLMAPAIPQIVEQELPPTIRNALMTSFESSVREYLESGLYHSRTAALRKWVAARDGVGSLVGGLRRQRHTERFVYKEPFLSFSPHLAYDALPDARLVWLYRDGRDVADSLVRTYDILRDEKLTHLRTNEVPLGRLRGDRYVPWWVGEGDDDAFLATSPYVRSIWMWRVMVQRCHDFFSDPDVVATGRVLPVRYEDLVREPIRVGAEIADHVGGPLTRRMQRRLRRAHVTSIGIHRRRDADEIRAAERVAGSELELLGYTMESDQAPSRGPDIAY